MIPSKVKFLCLCVALFFICACDRDKPVQPADTPSGQKSSKTTDFSKTAVDVIHLEGGDWGYPSPYAHYPRGPGGFKMCLIFDSLLERDEKGLIPWLAEKYEISDNGKKYSFTVRNGVKWQDGKPLTTEDVCFSLKYACRHPMTWSYVFDAIEKVESGPGNTVSVVLKQPAASMLYNIGLTRIIPKHIWKNVKRPKEFTAPEAVIGSGPYRLTQYSKEHGTYGFEAFKSFWGPEQRVRRIEFVPVSEPVSAYENKKIDLVRISPDLLARFQKDSQHQIVKSPAFWGYRLLFNMDAVAALRDKRVRQAFAYSIDLEELVAKIARGAAVPGSAGILPPDHVMAAADVKTYPFDPQTAQRLLNQAGLTGSPDDGWRHPNGGMLDYELLCSSQEVRLAEVLQQRLAQSDIRIKVRSVDGKTRDTRVRNQDYQLAIIGHGGWGHDPEYLVAHFSGRLSTLTSSPSGSGMAGFDSPELMTLLARQQTETDSAKRREIVKQIQHVAALEVPEIPLLYTTAYNVYRPATYDGWMFMFDHHSLVHSKLSYLNRK
jgi:peptide/nickel transport system substrate-binding protein